MFTGICRTVNSTWSGNRMPRVGALFAVAGVGVFLCLLTLFITPTRPDREPLVPTQLFKATEPNSTVLPALTPPLNSAEEEAVEVALDPNPSLHDCALLDNSLIIKIEPPFHNNQGLRIHTQQLADWILAPFTLMKQTYPHIFLVAPPFPHTYKLRSGFVPFTDLLNISKFPYLCEDSEQNRRKIPLTMTMEDAIFQKKTGLVRVSSHQYIAVSSKYLQGPNVTTLKNSILKDILSYPSQPMIDSTTKIKEKMLAKFHARKFTCLHLRTEKDFKYYWTESRHRSKYAFVSLQDTISKIVSTFSGKNDSEAFDLLYIAGNHGADVLENFRNLGIWKHVTNKAELYSEYKATDDPTTLYASVDFEMCKFGSIFIGNNYSGFSELVVDYLLWFSNLTRTESIFQVNESNEGDKKNLVPFCPGQKKVRHPELKCKSPSNTAIDVFVK